jgi:hypothetical protein
MGECVYLQVRPAHPHRTQTFFLTHFNFPIHPVTVHMALQAILNLPARPARLLQSLLASGQQYSVASSQEAFCVDGDQYQLASVGYNDLGDLGPLSTGQLPRLLPPASLRQTRQLLMSRYALPDDTATVVYVLYIEGEVRTLIYTSFVNISQQHLHL